MSKSITAKDFAQKMIEWYEDQSSADSTAQAADLAADIGLTLAPEKPEPGTWHLTVNEGWPAYVDLDGDLVVRPDGDVGKRYFAHSNNWPALTPARVVPAEPVELSEAEVGVLWDANRDNAQWSWTSRGPAMWRMMTATVNASRRTATGDRGQTRVPTTEVERLKKLTWKEPA